MDEKGIKSFWERPEGTTGMIFGVLGLFAAGWGAYTILPYLVSILQNTVYAGILAITIAALAYVFVFDPRMRNLIGYMYKSVMRWITGWFIEIDPIGILKSYIDTLKGNLKGMDTQIGNLRGQMRKLKEAIDGNATQMKNNLQMAERAKDQNMQSQYMLKARKAGRLQSSNMTLQTLYSKMEVMYRVLTKMYETCQVMIEDMEDEVQVKSREREMIKASHSVFKSAMKIINGDSSKKEMFDQTMEYLTNDYGQKLGEIERFMEISTSFIDNLDLQNGIYEENALALLEKWEKEGDSILLGDSKKMLIHDAYDPKLVLDMSKTAQRIK